MQCRNTKTNDDTAKYTHLKGCDTTYICNRTGQHCVRTALDVDQCPNGSMHDEKCNNSCQRCYFFFLFRHTDCYTHCKYNRQIRKNNVTGSVHNLQDLIQYGSRSHNAQQTVSFQHCFVRKRSADSQQQTCDRQNSDRQHKGTANPLQNSKNFVFHSSPHSLS